MPMKVVGNPEVDAADVDFVVCHRVIDLPIPATEGATIEHCTKCGERVWIAPTSPKKPPKVCFPCGMALVEADGEEPQVFVSKRTAANPESMTHQAIKKLLHKE